MSFLQQIAPGRSPAEADLCLVIQGDSLLLEQGGPEPRLVRYGLLKDCVGVLGMPIRLGLVDGQTCWVLAAKPELGAPAGCEWKESRALLPVFDASQIQAMSCARELLFWHARTRFCGCCGAEVVDADNERARRCTRCSTLFFPSASAAVIVAVTRGDHLLLAHNRNFRPNLFSLLAGFVDPGETLEQAVHREVMEEVGVEVADLEYCGSQPWPFPNSLMVGFRARYVSGEIKVDGKELHEAGWFSRDALPEIPKPGTVAHAIIQAWIKAT